MLPHQHAGKAVRVHFGFAVGLGYLVSFPESLAKGLAKSSRENTLAPCLKFRLIGKQRMPQPDVLCPAHIDRLSLCVADLGIDPHSRVFVSRSVAEYPNQSSAETAEQRMLDEMFLPVLHRHPARTYQPGLEAS